MLPAAIAEGMAMRAAAPAASPTITAWRRIMLSVVLSVLTNLRRSAGNPDVMYRPVTHRKPDSGQPAAPSRRVGQAYGIPRLGSYRRPTAARNVPRARGPRVSLP